MTPQTEQLPRIQRSLGRRDLWNVFEPNGDFVATYRTRERARRWIVAAGFMAWREESWVQRRCTGTPRATSRIVISVSSQISSQGAATTS